LVNLFLNLNIFAKNLSTKFVYLKDTPKTPILGSFKFQIPLSGGKPRFGV